MASAENVYSVETAVNYANLQRESLATYSGALQVAMEPLESRYLQALSALTEVQQNYLQELGRRVTAAYQSYCETVASISAGSGQLEQAVEAYSSFSTKYARFIDPCHWASIIAPAQQRLNEAIAQAQSDENAVLVTQQAIEIFYSELNEILQNDSLATDLSEAQLRLVEQLGALQTDIGHNWQLATETINESVSNAVTETTELFDVNSAVESFAQELGAIGEDIAEAYRSAAGTATEFWEENSLDKAAAPAAMSKSATSIAAATEPKPVASPKTPDSAQATKAMGVSTAKMPRASWVNVPAPEPNVATEAKAPSPAAKAKVDAPASDGSKTPPKTAKTESKSSAGGGSKRPAPQSKTGQSRSASSRKPISKKGD